MRSLAIFISIFSTLPVALVLPFAGVLLWAWIAFMSPHREAYGFAFDFPFNFYVAATTMVTWLLSQEPKRLPPQTLPILFFALAVLISITTYFALDHAYSLERWDKHVRSLALVLVVMAMVNSKLRIQAFLWVIALSIGYFAAKGGGGILFSGFGSRIYGPDGTAIADNNELAVAICMTLPILYYLRSTTANPLVKAACIAVGVLSVIAVIGTFSRSGFVALVAVAIAFVLLDRPRLATVLVPGAVVLGIWTYAPAAWFQRIETIETYKTDESASQRLAAWQTSWRMAVDRPILGGGFSAVESEKAFRYVYVDWRASEEVQAKSRNRAAHSIYFQVMSDHGFLGLGLWLTIVAFGMINLMRVLALSRDREDLKWARALARALVLSFSGYLVGGAFLSMAYYDVFLCLIALTVPLRDVVTRAVQGTSTDLVDPMAAGWRTASARRLR